MSRFFFRVLDAGNVPPDDGYELPSLVAAQRVAADIASELLRDNGEELWKSGSWRVEVTRDDGTLVLALKVIAETVGEAAEDVSARNDPAK